MPCKPCLANPHKTLRELVDNVDKLTQPMQLSTEYHTGRYFKGKPIYTKIIVATNIQTGKLAQIETGIPGVKIVYAEFMAFTASGSFKPEPFIDTTTGDFMGGLVSINGNGSANYFFKSADAANYTIYLVIEYTK